MMVIGDSVSACNTDPVDRVSEARELEGNNAKFNDDVGVLSLY
jgi:hypothetical protein